MQNAHVAAVCVCGQLGCYEESHSQLVTDLIFHPEAPMQLVSASEDGLLCVFNVAAPNEDEAADTVVATEDAIRSIGLFGPKSAFA